MIGSPLPRRRRLLFSLFMNFMTRVPSVAIIFIFLPALRDGLGVERYGQLLTSLAAGGVLAIPFSGFGQMTARLVGAANSLQDQADEARAFNSSALVNVAMLLVLVAGLAAFVLLRRDTNVVFLVALLPIVQACLNAIVDMTRLAYNEHYVTVSLSLTYQVIVYATAFLVPAFTQHILLAAVIFSGPLVVGSLSGAILLVAGRPYLLRGGTGHVREIGLKGISFSLADGLLVSSLNIVTVWLGSTASPVLTAWFASVNRVFQMVLNPLVLVMVPIAAYFRSIWHGLPAVRRNAVIFATATACMAFGIATAALIAMVDRYYIAGALQLSSGADFTVILPIFALLGVIAGYKGFSLIAYLVLDVDDLVRATVAIFAGALAVGWLSSFVLMPLDAVRVFCILAAVPEAALLVWATWKHRRGSTTGL